MSSTNRSTATPYAIALFLLTLVLVHGSVELVGSNLGYGSRVASMAAAWKQVGSVFLSVYQPSSTAQMLALHYAPFINSEIQNIESVGDQVACLDNPASSDYQEPGLFEGYAGSQESVNLPDVASHLSTTLPPRTCNRSSAQTTSSRERRDRTASPKRTVSLRKELMIGPFELGERVRQLSLQTDGVTNLIERNLAGYRVQVLKLEGLIDLKREAKLIQRRLKAASTECNSKVNATPVPAADESVLKQPATRGAAPLGFEWRRSKT